MAIKKVKEDLYKSNSKYAKREHNETVYKGSEFEDGSNQDNQSNWQGIQDRLLGTRAKAIVVGATALSIIAIISLMVAAFVYFQRTFFIQDNVQLQVIAPETADSNQLVEIVFAYENNNRASLSEAEIKVNFGKYFIPISDQQNFRSAGLSNGVISIGNIEQYSKSKISLAGHFVGPEDSVENIIGDLYYKPEKTNVIYSTQGRSATTITSSPIVIDFDSPKELVSGSNLDLKITAKNTSRQTIRNIKLIIDYPNTFSLQKAEPSFAQNNTWFIDELAPQDEISVNLKGILGGDLGMAQKFKAQVETQAGQGGIVYAIHEYAPIIIGSPIILDQKISGIKNDIAYVGNILSYSMSFLNDSELPIRDAIIKVFLKSEVLDFSELDLDRIGYYDSKNKSITWKASDIPALKLLEPHDSGEVHFTIPVTENFPIDDTTDTNFVIETQISIDSEDIPSPIRNNKTILTNSHLVKVGAQIPLTITGQYKSGVLPPQVGKKTTYTFTIEAGSHNNDLKDAVVSAVLPTGVTWEGNVSGDKEDNFVFNERSNSFTWNIGGITHGEGLLLPAKKVSFDVSIIPSIEQTGSSPVLIKDINLKAIDLFTNTEASVNHLQKTTFLEEDKQVDKKEVVIE